MLNDLSTISLAARNNNIWFSRFSREIESAATQATNTPKSSGWLTGEYQNSLKYNFSKEYLDGELQCQYPSISTELMCISKKQVLL